MCLAQFISACPCADDSLSSVVQHNLFWMLPCPALTPLTLMPVFTILCRCSSAIPSSLLVPLMSRPVLKLVIIRCGASWAQTRPRSGTNNMATRPKGESEKASAKYASLILGWWKNRWNLKWQNTQITIIKTKQSATAYGTLLALMLQIVQISH